MTEEMLDALAPDHCPFCECPLCIWYWNEFDKLDDKFDNYVSKEYNDELEHNLSQDFEIDGWGG